MSSYPFIFGLIITGLCNLGCHQPESGPATRAVKPMLVQADGLAQLGSYSRFVALETHPEALLGAVTSVKIDPVSGDLLVADSRVTHALYRFDEQGSFIRRYGAHGSGPGEYETLFSFEILKQGRIAIFAAGKALLFEADGTLLREAPVDFNGKWAARVDDLIFIYTLAGQAQKKNSILVFDQALNQVGAMHSFDVRQDKLLLAPNNTLAAGRHHLIVSDFYDFQISVYRGDGSLAQRYAFPNQNHRLDSFWKQTREKMRTRQQIKKLVAGLRRAHDIYAFGSNLFFLESAPNLRQMRPHLLDLETAQALCYEGIRLVGGDKNTGYLTMDNLVGAFEKGILGVGNDPELYTHYRHLYANANIDYGDLDNPILMFFEINTSLGFTGASL